MHLLDQSLQVIDSLSQSVPPEELELQDVCIVVGGHRAPGAKALGGAGTVAWPLQPSALVFLSLYDLSFF